MNIARTVFNLLMIAWCIFYIAGLVKFAVTNKSWGKVWVWSSVGFCALMLMGQVDAGLRESAWHFAIALMWGLNIYFLISREKYWDSSA